jgi:hypothetical protein
MEKKIIIDKKDLDFELTKIKEVKRVDIHSDKIEIIFLLED